MLFPHREQAVDFVLSKSKDPADLAVGGAVVEVKRSSEVKTLSSTEFTKS